MKIRLPNKFLPFDGGCYTGPVKLPRASRPYDDDAPGFLACEADVYRALADCLDARARLDEWIEDLRASLANKEP